MFKKYRLRKAKKEANVRTSTMKKAKTSQKEERSPKEKVLSMLKNSTLLLNAFNRLITDKNLLDENIEEFSALVFANLMKCRKEKIITKNIDCIKKILESSEFHRVEDIAYDYLKSLFHLEKFPKRLFRIFHTKFAHKLENDIEFSKKLKQKF